MTEQQIKALTEYMFVPDNILKANVTIVLGQTLWKRPLEKAAELYQAKLAGTLVFTGGYNKKIGGFEALEMENSWANRFGLPLDNVLIESTSTNTMENMSNTKLLLEELGLLGGCLNINIVTINYHMRRAIETCRVVFGSAHYVGAVNYPSQYCDSKSWYQNSQGEKLILTESDKIRKYLLKHGGPNR